MDDHLPPRERLVLLAVIFEGGLGVAALALGWWLNCPALATFRYTPAAIGWGALFGLPMLGLLGLTMRLPVWPFSDVLRVVDGLLVPLFRDCRVIDLAAISILAGLGEEMLFRGVIQEWAARAVGGPSGVWVGLAAASLLFGLAHAITPSYVVLAGLMGVYLGWIWIATGNLLVPVTAHAVYDFLALVYLVKVRPRPSADVPEGEDADRNGDHAEP